MIAVVYSRKFDQLIVQNHLFFFKSYLTIKNNFVILSEKACSEFLLLVIFGIPLQQFSKTAEPSVRLAPSSNLIHGMK